MLFDGGDIRAVSGLRISVGGQLHGSAVAVVTSVSAQVGCITPPAQGSAAKRQQPDSMAQVSSICSVAAADEQA
jgi:hypothetical protein